MRRFYLVRHEDESGISGTGVIAEGVKFTNGWCYIVWLTEYRSAGFYESAEMMMNTHGHNGKTILHWYDHPMNASLPPRTGA